MTVDSIKVSPVVRAFVNLLVAANIGGVIAYLSWLMGAPQWLAIGFGIAAVIVYLIMWFGSADDSANA